MNSVRYIHAADLHLDTSFKGLALAANEKKEFLHDLQNASFVALERLVKLCIAEKPDFLVIAGDIYNDENKSLKAQFKLRDACEQLDAFNIKVFIAHGNHDPLSSLSHSITWPNNVVIFGKNVESYPILSNDELIAVVHGISHSKAKEARNLTLDFSRNYPPEYDAASEPCFHLGVLHCTIENTIKSDRYAPCSLADLRKCNLDAWALGHVHERSILSSNPFIAYSGNTQGLHIKETGEKGCLLVQATPNNNQVNNDFNDLYTCTPTFYPLAPVQWQSLELNIENIETFDVLEDNIHDLLENTALKVNSDCQLILARISLIGRSSLNAQLRTSENLQDLLDHLRDNNTTSPQIWIKDIKVKTAQEIDLKSLQNRDDLLGEIIRQSNIESLSPEEIKELIYSAVNPLYAHSKLRKTLNYPNDAELKNLLLEAQGLCIDLMETR